MWKEITAYTIMPEGVFMNTKIDDSQGVRCIQQLKRVGNLYYAADGTYVYYRPTHYFV